MDKALKFDKIENRNERMIAKIITALWIEGIWREFWIDIRNSEKINWWEPTQHATHNRFFSSRRFDLFTLTSGTASLLSFDKWALYKLQYLEYVLKSSPPTNGQGVAGVDSVKWD